MTTKPALELGDVEEDGVAISGVVYFAQNRVALRLEGSDGLVVAALSRDAADQLSRLLNGEGEGQS